MLRFVICEDNKEFLEKLYISINKIMMPYNFEYKINKFSKYNDKLVEIIEKKHELKVYILDIELGEVSGLEIASEIRENDQESIIIFITQHPECKNDIFYSRLIAYDYIAKNKLWKDRFESTISLIIKSMNKKRILSYSYNHNSYRIPFDEILYIEKIEENQKSLIHTENKEIFEITISMNKLINMLGPNFYQSHKSCIVNLDKVKKISYSTNTIIFNNKEEVYLISNRRKKELREYVAKY